MNQTVKPKILYIDDTQSSRRLVQRLLFANYEYYEASDGLAGIDRAVEIRPDMILVDLHMPHFSGYEVATRIKELLPGAPVVALTADMSDHVRERVLASGCAGYIAKPIDPDQFEQQVSDFLSGRREELSDDSYREEYQQTLVVRLEEKVRELTNALKSNEELNNQRDDLLKEAQRRAHLLEAGARISRSVTSILGLDLLLQTTVEIIAEEFNFYYVGIFLLDDTGEWLALRAGLGEAGAMMIAQGFKHKIGSYSLIGTATIRRQAMLAQDVAEAPVHYKNPYLPLTRSEMAVPLIVGNQVIGAMTVQSTAEAAFSDDDVRALQAIGDQLAVAIHNAKLYEQNEKLLKQAERRTRLLQAAADVGRGITSILDADKLLNKTVDVICDAYGFYYAGVFLLDSTGEWAVLRAGRGEAGAQMVSQGHKLKIGGLSMIGTAIAGRKALIALDVGEEPVHFKNPYLPLTRSEMALPLIVGDKVIGAVTVQSTEGAAFSNEDTTTLQAMADQLAIAIDNAKLLRDLEAAHQELVSSKTFQAIATATGEAIHWVGNKAAPLPGSVTRITEDLYKYLCMAEELVNKLPTELQDHKYAQMLKKAAADLKQHNLVNMDEVRADIEAYSVRQLQRMLTVDSILEDLEIIRQSARSILNIKEDLIGPARQKHVEPVSVSELVQRAVWELGISKDVVRFLLAENTPPVIADARQLRQVFVNLVKNAMEAMYKIEDKKLFVWVRAGENQNWVLIDVTDNGEGIPPDKVEKIWLAFYTTKGDRGGTGLGLSACASIINQMGGKITVESEVGVGTTFTIHLPAAPNVPLAAATATGDG